VTVQHILATGGGGFLGPNLCEVLLARGDSVTCLDDFSTGHADNIAGFCRSSTLPDGPRRCDPAAGGAV